jgi:hypothetical protein
LILVADSFPAVKWPELEADHPHPFGAEKKNAWSYFCSPLYLHGVVLSNHRNNVENVD